MAYRVLLVATMRSSRRPPRIFARRAMRGFTLVELGAVVTIVGILAVLAVVGYRRLITSSHNAEATHMINAIRAAQESYKAETGTYAAISGTATTALSITNAAGAGCSNSSLLYPMATQPANVKYAWGATCAATSMCPSASYTWDSLPVHVDGPVMYGYTTVAGPAGTAPASLATMYRLGTAYTLSFPTPTTDWFVVAACGDPNADGKASAYVSSSLSNEIFDSDDGD